MVKVCVDVDYREQSAVAACVLFRDWGDATPAGQVVEVVQGVAPYEPGQFYKRELPCLLAVLGRISETIELVIVDGYVWLADETRPGLGAHLHQTLKPQVPVIGVAKTHFASATVSVPVLRGETASRPLHVTAVGLPVEEAANCVKNMHGAYRLPTLLKMVDRLCRNS